MQDSSAAASAAPKNIFDAAREKHKKAITLSTDELEHYLSIEPDLTIEDPLAWWCSPERCSKYPQLSRMARCYLTIPGECTLLQEC